MMKTNDESAKDATVSNEIDASKLLEMINMFRTRASSRRNAARWTLFLIFVLCALGAGFFVYVAVITAIDSSYDKSESYTPSYDSSSYYTPSHPTQTKPASSGLDVRRSQITPEIAFVAKKLDEQAAILQSLKNVVDKSKATLESVQNEIEKNDSDLDAVKTSLSSIEASLTKTENEKANSDNITLIANIATRLGIILLMLFFVKFLVPLFSYNMRLAAFYDGKADALQITSTFDSGLIETFSNIFTPNEVYYGDSPKSLLEHAVESGTRVATGSLPK